MTIMHINGSNANIKDTHENTALKTERDRFVAFAFANADILMELSAQGKVLFADGATLGLLGKKAEELVGTNILRLLEDKDKAPMAKLMDQITISKRFDNIKLHLKNAKATPIPFAMAGYKLPYIHDRFFITLSMIRREISATDIGLRDLKTGLYTQEAFSHKASESYQHALEKGAHVKLSLFDMPELLTPPAGADPRTVDRLMDEICNYLQQHSYGHDTAGNVDNGTFMILHEADADADAMTRDIQEIAEKYVEKGALELAAPNNVDLNAPNLSEADCARALQYTINKLAEGAGDAFSLPSLADGYQGMLDETVKRISAFNHTIDDDAFELALQPIVDIRNKGVHHYEVLTRLRDNETFNNPFDFITFGEQAGIIGEFDLAMCSRVFKLLNEASDENKRPILAVNLSGLSISSDLFRDTLLEMLRMNDDVRHQVIFEVTESAKIHDLQDANEFLKILRKQGNLCCLDDFGVGESSFDYIRHLEVDFIKIDGSYVTDSLKSARGKHLLRAMIALCHDLQIVTIAEMVEDEHVSQFLASCGVALGQGYYYGKPSTDIDDIIYSDSDGNRALPPKSGGQVMTSNAAPKARKVPQTWARQGAAAV